MGRGNKQRASRGGEVGVASAGGKFWRPAREGRGGEGRERRGREQERNAAGRGKSLGRQRGEGWRGDDRRTILTGVRGDWDVGRRKKGAMLKEAERFWDARGRSAVNDREGL